MFFFRKFFSNLDRFSTITFSFLDTFPERREAIFYNQMKKFTIQTIKNTSFDLIVIFFPSNTDISMWKPKRKKEMCECILKKTRQLYTFLKFKSVNFWMLCAVSRSASMSNLSMNREMPGISNQSIVKFLSSSLSCTTIFLGRELHNVVVCIYSLRNFYIDYLHNVEWSRFQNSDQIE